MILVKKEPAVAIGYYGTEVLNIAADKHLKVETSPDGEDVLDAVVPTGKTWVARITVSIQEMGT